MYVQRRKALSVLERGFLMSVLRENIRLEGSKGAADAEATFDSGAAYSCIRPELARGLAVLEPLPRPLTFNMAQEGHTVEVAACVRLDFYLNGRRFSDEFMVVENLKRPVIIGAKTLQAWRMKLDFENEEVIVPRVADEYSI